jgi:hypothetical protein
MQLHSMDREKSVAIERPCAMRDERRHKFHRVTTYSFYFTVYSLYCLFYYDVALYHLYLHSLQSCLAFELLHVQSIVE